MRSSKSLLPILAALTLLRAAAADAAGVDMKDPRRAVGREDDIRVDAQLNQETLSPSSPVSVTYEIQNLTSGYIAVADKVADVSYDPETRMVTLSVGSEIPAAGAMPHLTTLAPGEKKSFRAAGTLHVMAPRTTSPFTAVPRQVQIKVNVLRDVGPFEKLIAQQARVPAVPVALNDAQFEEWMESSDAIFTNAIPVRWSGRGAHDNLPTAEDASAGTW
jgi:hypothetical protein